jgi:hypothetical protein
MLRRICLSMFLIVAFLIVAFLIVAMACGGGSSTTTSPSPTQSTQTYTGTTTADCQDSDCALSFPITMTQPGVVTVALVSVQAPLTGGNSILLGFGCALSCPSGTVIGSEIAVSVPPQTAMFTVTTAGMYNVVLINSGNLLNIGTARTVTVTVSIVNGLE